jgi:hypothetical protein
MSDSSQSEIVPPSPRRLRPAWIDWAWLALAAAVVVVMVVGCLRADRSFWRLACEHSYSLSSQRA